MDKALENLERAAASLRKVASRLKTPLDTSTFDRCLEAVREAAAKPAPRPRLNPTPPPAPPVVSGE